MFFCISYQLVEWGGLVVSEVEVEALVDPRRAPHDGVEHLVHRAVGQLVVVGADGALDRVPQTHLEWTFVCVYSSSVEYG